MEIIWGKVKKGAQRGKSLGFPTANIALHKNIAEGIYISQVKVNGKSSPALTFIGHANTFGEKKVLAETYFLRLSIDIYGKWISIKLLKKIRKNQKFKSAKELVVQMKKDKIEAEKYFSDAA